MKIGLSRLRFPPIAIIGILFFVFGFVSWINAVLIPYFKIVCELSARQSMMVAFAFYVSYFFMAIPSSQILKKTGLKKGMMLGLLIMSIGSLIFIPAAITRYYYLFLTGLFIQATGLTILQSASNPYVTLLGPIESAAKRISIMGVCNKVAGAIAPIILIQSITRNPDEIDHLQKRLPTLITEARDIILNELSARLLFPYIIMAVIFVALALLIKYAHLPDVEKEQDNSLSGSIQKERKNIFQFPFLILGAITVFFIVSVEVLAVDSIINYAQYMGYSFRQAKFFATYTLIFMIISYLLGILIIPRFVSQRKIFTVCAILGLLFTLLAIVVTGKMSVWFIAFLGFSNALLWPAIWPLAIDGLGKFLKQGSALLIMGIAGGAITPLLYGTLADQFNRQQAYIVLIPCYIFILFYSVKGYKIGKLNQSDIKPMSMVNELEIINNQRNP